MSIYYNSRNLGIDYRYTIKGNTELSYVIHLSYAGIIQIRFKGFILSSSVWFRTAPLV
jgi:hypothetical protein